jgi:hypothetical protein
MIQSHLPKPRNFHTRKKDVDGGFTLCVPCVIKVYWIVALHRDPTIPKRLIQGFGQEFRRISSGFLASRVKAGFGS